MMNTEKMHATQGLALLELMGFEPDEAENCLILSIHAEESPEGGPETITIRVADALGGIPGQETMDYQATVLSSFDHILSIAFTSSDARDVMALALAARNEQKGIVGMHSNIPEEDVFVVDDMNIHNPFGDDTYGDWVIEATPGSNGITLKNPVETYGADYVAWRDARAERLLQPEMATGPRL